MNILAVDTAGKTVGVALLQDDRLLYECYLDAGMTHSETLMPLIDNCLKLCGMGCKDINLYGVNAGPGSFTGLRIGLFFVGDGAALCYNKYGNVPGVLCVPPALRNGRAAAVAYVAEQMAQRGEAVLPEALLPDYHRLSQAERERAERLAAEAARTEIPEDTAKGKDQHQ